MNCVAFLDVRDSGTSNWSGDYFDGGSTGAALVVRRAPVLVSEMRAIFRRDWESVYAHPLDAYYEGCVRRRTANFCEADKDPAMLTDSI